MRRPGYTLLVGATLAAANVFILPGCRRETRHFSGGEPPPGAADQRRLSELQPGNPQPNTPVENPFGGNAYALSEGKRLFSAFNCVGCHANGGGDIGPPLMDAKWIYGAQPENVYASIVEGRPNGMPSFRGKITDQQVWELVAYVRSMSGQSPPAAAPSRNDQMKTNPPENSVKKEAPNSGSVPKTGELPP